MRLQNYKLTETVKASAHIARYIQKHPQDLTPTFNAFIERAEIFGIKPDEARDTWNLYLLIGRTLGNKLQRRAGRYYENEVRVYPEQYWRDGESENLQVGAAERQ